MIANDTGPLRYSNWYVEWIFFLDNVWLVKVNSG